MDKIEVYLKIFFSVLCTGCGYLFGKSSNALVYLIIMMLCDYALGLFKGIYTKTLDKDISFKGLIKKFSIFVIIIVATRYDLLMKDNNFTIRNMVCYFYIANETLSIFENCGEIGVPLPNKFKEIFKNLKKEND